MQAGPHTSISFTSLVPAEMQWIQDTNHGLGGRVPRPHASEVDGVVYMGGTQRPPQVCPGLSDSSAPSHTRHIHPSSPGRDAATLADQTQSNMHSLEDPESWQKQI